MGKRLEQALAEADEIEAAEADQEDQPIPVQRVYTITQARAKLSEVLREAEDADVVISNRSRPVAALVGINRYEAILDEIEDLRDRLSVHESGSEPTIAAEKLATELGL